jgi:PAS domain S-box-containing protein
MKFARWRRGATLPACAFLLGLGLAVAAGFGVQAEIDEQAEAAFGRGVARVHDEIVQRFHQPTDALNGARGLFAARGQVSRAEFAAYVAALDLEHQFAGVRGLGFVQRVERGNLERFVAAERADGAPGFAIRQLEDRTLPELFVVKFNEPPGRNAGALGLDLGSEARRRATVQRCIDSGAPTLTAPIVLVQDDRRSPGVVLYLPVYALGAAVTNVEQRRAALLGLVSAPIVIDELLAGVHDVVAGQLDFELLSALGGDSIFSAHRANADAAARTGSHPRMRATRALALPGRDFTLSVASTADFETAYARSTPWLVFAGGVLLSALLALLLWQQGSRQRRAETIARQMTADLERERAALANIIDGTGVGTWELNVETGEIRLNERWAQIVGYTLDELGPMTAATWHRLLHPDDRALSKVQRERHFSGAAPAYECEVRLRHKDGHWVWVHGRGQLFARPEEGAPRWMVGTHQDVSESKRAEAELRRGNEVMHSVFESLPCGLSVFDADLNLVASNAEFRRLLDLPDTLFDPAPVRFEDLVRFNAQRGEYGQGDVESLVRAKVAQVTPPLTPHRFERIRPNGTPIEVRGAPMPGGGIVSTYIDLSSRRNAEAQALRASALLRGSIDALDDAFALYDPEDRLVLCNQRYRDLYALCADMMVPGATFESIIRAGAERGQYPAALGRVDAWVAERMALHRQPGSHLQQRLADGRVLRIIERRMPDGHTVGFRVDITELVRATEAAEEASRAKTQFLANVSHEIRTPMSAILGMLTLLQRTPLAPAQNEYATKAQGAARSLLELLNEILDFSKTEQGKTALDAQPFRIDTLLGEVQAVAAGLVERKGLVVEVEVDPALPGGVVGDAMRLKQVLVNLVGNAVKFTESGSVNLRVRLCERVATAVTLEFAVSDTGIGIAQGDLQRIFDAFTQAEASTTRRFGGTGLGLAISRQLVRLMGGELGVDSVLGQGSRFHFRVALAVAQGEGSAPAAPAAIAAVAPAPSLLASHTLQPKRLDRLRILIVEDNADIQLIASELLSHEGARVQLAKHGQDALDRLVAPGASVDAVLMDLQMPVMDGLTAARHIRGRLGLTALPIIAVSANAMASDRQACLAAGMNDHVGKPFDLNDLVRVLLRHTGRRERAAADAPREPELLSEALCDAAARADVDIRAALARLGSGTSVYLRLLSGFRAELEALPQRLRVLLAQRDTAGAARALHSLKGLAATLGAMRLSAVAAQGETQLASPQAVNVAQDAVERACEAIAAARPGIEALALALQSEPGARPGGAAGLPAIAEGEPRSRAAAHESLGRLARLLGESNMEALHAMQALQRDFGAVFGAALDPLDQATHALDFVRARQLCRELEQAALEGHAA